MSVTATRRRVQARVEGTVQGVGFRPFVYRLASELGLAGWVFNDARGVLVEVEGAPRAVDEFLTRLAPEAPALAVVEQVRVCGCPAAGDRRFEIRESPAGETAQAPVTPDTATCEDCVRELLDPSDRRYRYPFITCTNCGPRFTIVQGIPYDRPLTTMAGFRMCSECQREYDDPTDRRFHAQPNACPRCGPSVALVDRAGRDVPVRSGADAIATAAAALAAGKVLAVKGVGGYHLACRADDESAVAALRARKHREDKPFALMARDTDAVEELVLLDPAARELLLSPQRPIVLAPRRTDAPVARAVAPGAPELGVMLPYSPLHHVLLLDAGATLVMTSGNVSDEPIAFTDAEARSRLASIADLFLVHDRPIETRTDDSVLRVDAGRPTFLRRSRGYVPGAIPLPGAGTTRSLLACGAELKSTFCVAKGTRAWVSHHIGDLTNAETLRSFTEGIVHFERLFAVSPEVVAHDLHPNYLSTAYASERDDVELIGVQHHHAHLAACLAEHGFDPTHPAIGAIYDGTGYGTDGTIWGGEILCGDIAGFRRVGALTPVRMPGGERAIRQPWRMACSWLLAAGGDQAPALPPSLVGRVDPEMWRQVALLAANGLASPVTSSVGRLFDAVAALCGIRPEINYEGQAAIELEAASDPLERGAYPIDVLGDADGFLSIDASSTIAAVLDEVSRGVAVATIGARFHAALTRATVQACARAASDAGVELVVLSGGAFANRTLSRATVGGLEAAGLRVLTPHLLPMGDGGVSYGQAAVAAARM